MKKVQGFQIRCNLFARRVNSMAKNALSCLHIDSYFDEDVHGHEKQVGEPAAAPTDLWFRFVCVTSFFVGWLASLGS